MCADLAATPAEGSTEPPYCDWFGVRCCGKDQANDEAFDYKAVERSAACKNSSAVSALFVPANGLCGTVADLMDVLTHLHDCGLRDLSLSANNLTGALPPEMGRLTNLRCH